MSKLIQENVEGRLVAGVYSGGEKALWQMARSGGNLGELAIQALELVTMPDSDFSAIEAVNAVVGGPSREVRL